MIGIAIEDDHMARSVEAVLDKSEGYETRRFSGSDIQSGHWPGDDYTAIVASSSAIGIHRRKIDKIQMIRRPIVVILRSDELMKNRDVILYSDSFVLYDYNIARLPNLIRICRHRLAIMPNVSGHPPGRVSKKISMLHNLPNGERMVLAELGRGTANRQIASRLNLTVSRVKDYIRQITGRLGFRNRTDAGVFAAAYLFDDYKPTTTSDDE